MAHTLKLYYGAEVTEGDDPLQLASIDERMKHALDCLRQEHLLLHGYDYIWIMRYINEEHLKGTGLFFCSVNSYRSYIMVYMKHSQVAGVSTLSHYYHAGDGRFPDWTFTDTTDAAERLRRINVARRFAAIFVKGC